VPHYSFQEIDQLLGKSPDIIVIPYMPMDYENKYKPVREWIQKHSKTTLLSICDGAANLADTGLLKGKTVTSHWKNISFFQRQYPDTNWVRDRRYVLPDKNIVSSAGLTSGIDAVLYVISKKLGEPMAEKIAKEMNYPSYHFVKNPKVDPYYVDRSQAVYIANQAFQWNKKKAGVLLYNGVEDGALASVFDTYAASGTTKLFTISSSDQPIVTKHNLNLIARYQMSNAPKIDKMFVTGTQAKTLAAEDVKQWNEKGNTKEVQFLHSDAPDRFVFDAPLEDLAKQEDILTAKYGAKRLEYRAEHLKFEGRPFSFEAFGIPFLLSLLAVLIAFYIDRRFIMKKPTFKSYKQAS
jgi:AraC family transcriptional activator FtrA